MPGFKPQGDTMLDSIDRDKLPETTPKIEVEKTIELTQLEFSDFHKRMQQIGYRKPPREFELLDYFENLKESKVLDGGYDFTRVRKITDTQTGDVSIIEEKKIWIEGLDDKPIRDEQLLNETVDSDFFNEMVSHAMHAQIPLASTTRYEYDINFFSEHGKVCIDCVDFGDGFKRYFVEAEIISTPAKAESHRFLVSEWLRLFEFENYEKGDPGSKIGMILAHMKSQKAD